MTLAVERKFKIFFLIQTNRNLTQILNHVRDNVLTRWVERLTADFAGYQFGTPATILQDSRVFATTTAGRFWVYPKFAIQSETTDADIGWNNLRPVCNAFIDDVANLSKSLIGGLSANTTIIEAWKRDFDGNMVMIIT